MLCDPQRLISSVEGDKLRLEEDVSPDLQRTIDGLDSAEANLKTNQQ